MASRRTNSPTYPLLSRPSSPQHNTGQELSCTSPPTLPNITVDHTNGSYHNIRWGHYITSLIFSMGAVGLLLLILRDTTLSAVSINGASSSLATSPPHASNDSNTTEGVLDFAIVGFEKTGTTFLLSALGSHPEVTMPIKHSKLSKRICTKREHGKTTLVDWLNGGHEEESTSLSSRNIKHGIKCSDLIVQKTLAIERMAEISDQTKLIVGVRHPVLWYQSLYNYRVRQSYDLNWTRPIPSPHELNGTKQWKGISILSAKFETYLQQLAKVPMSKNDVMEMVSDELDIRISPNPFKVFMYTIEQLEDTNTSRLLQFENDIQTYLNLQSPLKHFASKPKENVNSASYPEFINVCDEQYRSFRNTLIEQGAASSLWIREKFIKSKDVVVSDVQYFDSILRTWSVDPCDDDVKEGREEEEEY